MDGSAIQFLRLITGNLMLVLFIAADGAYAAFVIGMLFSYPCTAGFAGTGMGITIQAVFWYIVHVMLMVHVAADSTSTVAVIGMLFRKKHTTFGTCPIMISSERFGRCPIAVCMMGMGFPGFFCHYGRKRRKRYHQYR